MRSTRNKKLVDIKNEEVGEVKTYIATKFTEYCWMEFRMVTSPAMGRRW